VKRGKWEKRKIRNVRKEEGRRKGRKGKVKRGKKR